jgi:hypothetical protein
MPPGAYNRVADNWRPLFAIAHVAGGDWPRRALEAFNHLTNRRAETDACHSLSASGAAGEASVKKNKVGQGDVARSSLSQSAICTLQSAIDTGEVASSLSQSAICHPPSAMERYRFPVELLSDIRQIFGQAGATRLSCKQLLTALQELERTKSQASGLKPPMTSRSLGHHLHRFGISSRCLRIDGQSVKGYELADFSDAFTRFLKL